MLCCLLEGNPSGLRQIRGKRGGRLSALFFELELPLRVFGPLLPLFSHEHPSLRADAPHVRARDQAEPAQSVAEEAVPPQVSRVVLGRADAQRVEGLRRVRGRGGEGAELAAGSRGGSEDRACVAAELPLGGRVVGRGVVALGVNGQAAAVAD